MALLVLSALSFTACGGGGGGGNNSGGGQRTVTVSGTVSYEFVPPHIDCNGLNFAGTLTRPIRGATVQLLNGGSGAQIASTVSTNTGNFSFSNVAANTSVRLRVRAELKQAGPPGWDVEVRDNFIAGASDLDVPAPPALATRALYTLDGTSFNTGSANVTRNLTATTGWGVNSYTGPRTAAPFALLDTIYTAMQFVRGADANADFPPLDAFWSVNNKIVDTDFDITMGDLPTSFYRGDIDALFILGDDTDDTDEFDDHVVAHEWGHYFEDNLSRSDSFGGSHSLGETLDARLAFGEGWATALASMALDDPIYCDTGTPGTPDGNGINAESTSFGVQGWFNELSVITFIYDLWDSTDEPTDLGSIGFGPIYDVMTGPQVFTEGFTTLFSFATELRASLNAQGQALVDSQLDRVNVVSGLALDIWATNETNHAGVAQDVFPLYTPYVADGSVLNICVNSSLDGLDRHGNNLAEDRYLRITVPADDQYDVSVVTTTAIPVTPDPDDREDSDPDIYIIRGAGPELIAFGTEDGGGFEPTFTTPMMFASETYAAIIEEWRFEDDATSITYPERICFDVSLTPTP
jgi:hypothetical protein